MARWRSSTCWNRGDAGHFPGVSPERERLEAVYAAHGQAVLAYALRRTDAATADDVLSDVFLAAWRRINELPSEPLPWLLGTARKALANQRRSADRHAALGERVGEHSAFGGQLLGVSAASAIDGSDASSGDHGVLAALASLSEEDRELLLLIAWDDLTPRNAARALGINAAACSMRLTRARRRLAVALETVPAQSDPAASPIQPPTTNLECADA